MLFLTHSFRTFFIPSIIFSLLIIGGNFNSTTNLFNNESLSVVDTFTVQAHPGPANNGGSPNWAIFFNLIADSSEINVVQMSTASSAAANASYSVAVFIRSGTALGGPVSIGPGSSFSGWTALDTVPVTQGTTGSGISLIFNLPSINVTPFDTVGVALQFFSAGPRYFTGTTLTTYSDSNISIVTGDVRSVPFTPTGSYFSPRLLVGSVRYVIAVPSGLTNEESEIPNDFKLAQNYPNPFNPVTNIQFGIPEKSNILLKVYNSLGQIVATLANGDYLPGIYNATWEAFGMPSGIYYYSLITNDNTITKKMMLVK